MYLKIDIKWDYLFCIMKECLTANFIIEDEDVGYITGDIFVMLREGFLYRDLDDEILVVILDILEKKNIIQKDFNFCVVDLDQIDKKLDNLIKENY